MMRLNRRLFIVLFKVFLLTLPIAACYHSEESTFKITNQTNKKIENLSIQPDENLQHSISIAPRATIVFKTDLKYVAKEDGSYWMQFQWGDTTREINFGNYRNGYPIEHITKIIIKADTVIIIPVYK